MVFIVTNQSGVARGMMTVDDVNKVNEKMLSLLGKGLIDDILICTHGPDENCSCRKPGTTLVERAAKEHGIDLSRSYSIGDKDSDKELGVKMGGNGIKLGEKGIKTLLDAAKTIVKENK
jgi:histidinol-phosphate phosphatase family protein